MKWISTAAVLLLTASMAFAAPGRGKGSGKDLKDLNLTNEQRAAIEKLEKAFRQDSKEAFKAARAASKEYREARRAGDTAKMAELKPEVEARREALEALRDAYKAAVRALLTPEQASQWDSRRRQRRGH